MMRARWLTVLFVYFGAQPVFAQPGADVPVVDRVRLEQRFAAVDTLIERSSGARQIEASGVADARDRRERAREAYRQARAAYDAGQYERASQMLPQASVHMFEAVRLAAPDQITGPKLRVDFEARLESVNSLHAAYRRVAAEKPGTVGAAETSREIDQRIGEARRLADAGRIESGRAELDRAYLIAKAAVSTLRGGDTLVRSLEFSSKEDEYRYEIDRNETHQMLIKVLLAGRLETSQARGFIERATGLRAQAEGAAARRDHIGAIQLLEQSTRELVRGIRGAGIYIPG